MKKIFNKLNIKQKILFAIFIPMATIILTTLLSFLEKKDSIDKLDSFLSYYKYYQKVGNIIYDLEKERALAFSYIGSEGNEYEKDNLFRQRDIVDKKFSDIQIFLNNNQNTFSQKQIRLIDDNIDQLELFRYDVDRLNLFLDIEENFYTDLIYNLLYSTSNIPAMTDNKYLSNQSLAYKHLIEAKEYLSLEVGLLNYISKSKHLTLNDIHKLEYFNAFYKTNLVMFKYFLSTKIKEKFLEANINQYHSSIKMINTLKKLPILEKKQIKKARDLKIIKLDMASIDLKSISNEINKKIIILKEIEDSLANEILFTIKNEKDRFFNNLLIYLCTIIIIVLIVFTIGLKISQNIIEKILILEKGLVSFLKYVKREEKRFKPIILNGQDEINHMATIINASIKETAYYVELEVKKAKRLQSQMMEAEKMAQMGEMIGNIAHQWRQPLSIISTLATGISVKKEYKQPLGDKELISNMDEINRYTQYLSDTINTFRDFIKEKKEFKKQTLQENISSALSIVRAVLDDVEIKLIDEVDYKDLIHVQIVSGELPQVLINIINNAKDVIKTKEIKNGWIKLNMQKFESMALITIEDNGGGINDKIKNKIFEPYFTTKHKSQGTGLGLHMSYRIITESLKGKIYTKNTKNGAKFFIELPF